MTTNRATECCPDCRTPSPEIGPIPPTDTFAGRTLERIIGGGALYRCPECHLGFRAPRPSKEELDRLYAAGNPESWTASPDNREDWRLARDTIDGHLPEGASILDVGCFDGGFLEPLVGRFDCHGIEVHREARARAERKGIRIVGADFEDMRGRTFDCITAHDVIEHVESPRAFLDLCLSSLKPGGMLLICTGNLDSLTFRLMKSRYWYCHFAEHISFISPRWVKEQVSRRGIRCERMIFFAHCNATLPRRLREAAANMTYRFAPFIFRSLRRCGLGGKNARNRPALADHPPTWGSAKDHFMVLLTKS